MSLTNKQKNIGRLCMAGAALCWGLAGVCIKSISWGPMSIMFVRSICSLIMQLLMKRSLKFNVNKINITGAIAMSLCSISYVIAIKFTTAGTAIVLQYIAPILVFIYALLFQKRKAEPYEYIIIFTVFIGVILSFADSLDPTRIMGNAIGLFSGFAFAAQIVIMNNEEASSQDGIIFSNIISALVSVPFLFTDKTIVFDAKNIFWLLILGFVQFGTANILFGKGIKIIESVESSLILTLEPIFNPIPVAIICHEMMGTLALVGFAVVIISVTAYGVMSSKKS